MTSEVDPIVVVGKRKRVGDKPYFGPDGGGGGAGDGGGWDGGSGGMTQEQADAENLRQEQCAAKDFHSRLQSMSTRNSKESFSFILNRGGNTLVTPPATAGGVKITEVDINPVLSGYGINMARVVGFVHNHPRNYYCSGPGLTEKSAQEDLNAYPSENDWEAAKKFVELGADPDKFRMYIVGCDNVLREFPYSNKAHYLSQIQRSRPTRPAPVAADCPN